MPKRFSSYFSNRWRDGVLPSEKNKEVLPGERVGQEDAKGTQGPQNPENGPLWLGTLWNTRMRQYLIQHDASCRRTLSYEFSFC